MLKMLRPLHGLLKEHSDCYRDGGCPECRDLNADVKAALLDASGTPEGDG